MVINTRISATKISYRVLSFKKDKRHFRILYKKIINSF